MKCMEVHQLMFAYLPKGTEGRFPDKSPVPGDMVPIGVLRSTYRKELEPRKSSENRERAIDMTSGIWKQMG